MKNHIIATICLLCLPISFLYPLSLDETRVIEMALREAPRLREIQSEGLKVKVRQSEFSDSFRLRSFVSGSYQKTKENAFIEFNPVISPHSTFQVGLSKRLPLGLSTSLSTSLDRGKFDLSGVGMTRVTSETAATLSADLGKNIFGRIDRATGESLNRLNEHSQLLQNIQKRQFINRVRGHFWRVAAIDQSIKISQKLLELAKRQEKYAQARFKSSVADRSEVARYKAQTANRQGQIYSLAHRRELEIRELKSLVPDLEKHQIELAPYNLQKVVDDVMQCVAVIRSRHDIPLDYTLFDEMSGELNAHFHQQRNMASTYNANNIQLTGKVFAKSVGDSASDAFSDSFSEKRNGFSLALSVEIPFGHGGTKNNKVLIQELEQKRQDHQTKLDLASSHQFMKKAIGLLVDAVEAQEKSTKNLQIRLKEMRRKFKQGRISAAEYILDEDALLSSELSTIDIKSTILRTNLEYLSIFTQTPCAFNQVPQVQGLGREKTY